MNITVTNDNIVEGAETFTMQLNVPSSLGPGITADIGRNRAVGVISDSTSKNIMI